MQPPPERFVRANGVDLCVQTFGPADAPPLLLVGNTMLTWDDELCAQLSDGPRLVVRYDQRRTGRTRAAPGYALRDLVADAAALLDALGIATAHVAGMGPGGWIAQLLALDHPAVVGTLTLVGTRPTAPGPADDDLPDHDPELMAALLSAPQPDWSDPDAVVEFMVAGARHLAGSGPYSEDEVRDRVRRIAERAGSDPAVAVASQLATPFAEIDCGPRWRERLGSITAPTLVVHGADDPFFPVGNAEALAREIPDAELLVLPGTGQELPRRTWEVVVEAMVRHTA